MIHLNQLIFNLKTLIVIVGFLIFGCKEQPNNSKEVLLYISKASGNFDIYKNDLSGNEVQLTTNPSWDWSPMWNPTSQSIIYYSYVNDTFKIQSMGVDGKSKDLDTKGFIEFNISPDLNYLVMERNRGKNKQLMIVNLSSGKEESITDSTAYNGRAKWSPDSKKLVYISDRDGNNEVYLYDLINATTERLTENSTSEKYLTWAPDNRRIAFSTEYYEEGKPDRNDLFIMDTETKEIIQLTDNPFEDSEIAWSPSSERIAFHSKRDSIDHIFVMDIDGTNVKQITVDDVYHGEPAWAVVESGL